LYIHGTYIHSIYRKAIYVGVIFAITLGVAAYSTYFERIFAAFFQDRVGPDRAGPFGILQPLADAVKMFMKEDFIPANSSKWLFILAFMFVYVYSTYDFCCNSFWRYY
jgi:NADH:ubiquinone oxidoreductase subunit H